LLAKPEEQAPSVHQECKGKQLLRNQPETKSLKKKPFFLRASIPLAPFCLETGLLGQASHLHVPSAGQLNIFGLPSGSQGKGGKGVAKVTERKEEQDPLPAPLCPGALVVGDIAEQPCKLWSVWQL
jgi:hypothetical protein